jgi:hypothetical protein
MTLAETASAICFQDFQSPLAIFQPIATILEKPSAAAPPRPTNVSEETLSYRSRFSESPWPSDDRSTAAQDAFSSAAVGLGLIHPSILPAYSALAANLTRPTATGALLFLFRIAAALTHCRAVTTRPFIVSFEESGATTLEWLFPHARLVFAFENDGCGTYSFCGEDREPRFGEISPALAIEQLLSSTRRP